jgi:hypothetical protein
MITKKYYAVFECMNTYEMGVDQEGQDSLQEAIDWMKENIPSHIKHLFMFKILAIDTCSGIICKLYFARSARVPPANDFRDWMEYE